MLPKDFPPCMPAHTSGGLFQNFELKYCRLDEEGGLRSLFPHAPPAADTMSHPLKKVTHKSPEVKRRSGCEMDLGNRFGFVPQSGFGFELGLFPCRIEQILDAETDHELFIAVLYLRIKQEIPFCDQAVVFICRPVGEVAITDIALKPVFQSGAEPTGTREPGRQRDIIHAFRFFSAPAPGQVDVHIRKQPFC